MNKDEWIRTTDASIAVKDVFSDSNNIILRHEFQDISKKGSFSKFRFKFYVFKLCMIMCVGVFQQTSVMLNNVWYMRLLRQMLPLHTELISA